MGGLALAARLGLGPGGLAAAAREERGLVAAVVIIAVAAPGVGGAVGALGAVAADGSAGGVASVVAQDTAHVLHAGELLAHG